MGRGRGALLLLAGAVLGAGAMLVGLTARHDYGLKQALVVAEAGARFPSINTGDPPPPPDARELAQARPACAAIARASGLSLTEVSVAGGLLFRVPPPRDVDQQALAASFGIVDRLRMTLAGLSRADRERALQSVTGDPQDGWRHRRMSHGLADALRNCQYLDPAPPRLG